VSLLEIQPAADLNLILSGLGTISHVLASAVARRDGVIIEHALPPQVDPRRVAAMTATIVGTGEIAAGELGLGEFQKIMVYGKQGTMIAMGAGEEAILVTLARGEGNVGLLLLAVERGARSVADSLMGA
jgi:hypothetical protein